MTAIHRMVAQCRAGEYAPAVIQVRSGWVVLGERQVFPGYCLLLPDPVVPDLNALAEPARAQFLADMGRVGDALIEALDAVRVNYAIFGNVEPALHAHLFPRQRSEPDATRTAQPWALDWNRAPAYAAAHCAPLKERIAACVRRRGVR
jgi:diadenosine tetraphosphate (Ap4A) HIT family hydrolase